MIQFAVDDKVIHPRHGAGRITGIQQKGPIDELKSYYVIYVPGQRLTVYVPLQQMEQNGVRLAMSPAKMPSVMDTLKSAPHRLEDDLREREQRLWAKLGTGYAVEMAEVVRDLTWRRRQSHLTRKDSEYLSRGREWLAAEMAMVTDGAISDANRAIDAALAVGMESAAQAE